MLHFKSFVFIGCLLFTASLLKAQLTSQIITASSNQPENCSPQSFRFDINDEVDLTGKQVTWIIKSDDGTREIEKTENPGVYFNTFTKGGTYTITARVDGSELDPLTIKLDNKPTASLVPDERIGCKELNVNFSNRSSKGEADAEIIEYVWDFGDLSDQVVWTQETENTENIEHFYNDWGNRNASLKIVDENGCIDEDTTSIFIQKAPVFNISGPNSICDSAYEGVYSAKIQPGTDEEAKSLFPTYDESLEFSWDFGNGVTASTALPNKVSFEPGKSYIVKLRINSGTNCKVELSDSVKRVYVGTIEPNIKAHPKYGLDSFELKVGQSNKICSDDTWIKADTIVDFIVDGVDTTRTDSIQVNFERATNHNLRVISTINVCPDTNDYALEISPLMADFEFDRNYLCQLPNTVNTVNNSIGATENYWSYSFLNTEDEVLLFDSIPSILEEQPNINFPMPVDTSDTNFTTQPYYDHEPLYNCNSKSVKLTVFDELQCYKQDSNDVKISLPLAQFVPDKNNGCDGMEVEFTDSSKYFPCTGVDDEIVSWKWIAEGVETLKNDNSNFSHTFNTPGVYDILLELETKMGCKDTSYPITIEVGEELTADFTLNKTTICYDETIQLGAVAFTGSENVDWWKYSAEGLFTMGDKTPNQTITLKPNDVGDYDVYLYADYNGCISQSSPKTLTIDGPGAANWEPELLDCGSPFVYNLKSFVSGADSYEWFVDGASQDTGATPSYNFLTSGDYDVKLVASNSTSGCPDTDSTITLKVRDVKANIHKVDTTICALQSYKYSAYGSSDYIGYHCGDANFDDECEDCEEGIFWDFGEYDTEKLIRLRDSVYYFEYVDKGDYTVTLTAKAANGCEDKDSIDIRVFLPDVDFVLDKDTNCAPTFTSYMNNAYTDSTFSGRYIWSLFQIFETVDEFGFPVYDTSFVEVKDDSIVGLMPLLPPTDSFEINHEIPKQDVLSGMSYNKQNFYDNYHIQLSVLDTVGCWNRLDTSVTAVFAKADFEIIDSVLNGNLYEYEKDTSNCSGIHTTFLPWYHSNNYSWDYDGDGTNDGSNNKHIYTLSDHGLDSFNVRRVDRFTTSDTNCLDTAYKKLYIQKPNAEFITYDIESNKIKTNFECVSVEVRHENTDTTFKFDWNSYYKFITVNEKGVFGQNDSVFKPEFVFSHKIIEPGDIKAIRYIQTKSPFECEDVDTNYYTSTGARADIVYSDDIICNPGDTVTLELINQLNVSSFDWFFDDGNFIKNGESPQKYVYNISDTLYPKASLFYEDEDTTCPPKIEEGPPLIVAGLINDLQVLGDKFCTGDTLEIFQGNNSPSDEIKDFSLFINGDLITNNPELAKYPINSSGEKEIIATATSIYEPKCQGLNDTANVLVNKTPIIELEDSIVKCPDDTWILRPEINDDISSITWTPYEDLTADDVFSPATTTKEDKTYYVTVMGNPGGCEATDSIKIVIPDSVDFILLPNGDTTIEIKQRIDLEVASIDDIRVGWSPDKYIEGCLDCDTTYARPRSNINYIVTVSDTGGCYPVSDTLFIIVEANHTIDFPQAFTPNGDGVNDIAFVRGELLKIVEEIRIYNRWGDEVFVREGIDIEGNEDMDYDLMQDEWRDKGWNGRLHGDENGRLLSTDTYTYFIRAKTVNDYDVIKKGSIVLMK